MRKIKSRFIVMLTAGCLAFATLGFALLPARASADTASDTAAVQKSRNENLIVKYGMDDTSVGNGAKLKALKWDSTAQAFVENPSADATVQNHVNNNNVGTLTSVNGIEGSSALSFTGKAHARADFNLPSNATGMTVSMWVKNVNTYWSSLVEFWDGKDGGRFGKGTMQGNGGRSNEGDPWSANCPAHNSATIATGGGWDSFVIKHNNTNNDNGGAAVDAMVEGKWYQVTYALTATEMRAYRDGELKQTFDTKNDAPKILQSIMKAVTSGNGKLGIRLGHDANDGDILDDFRIYNGAMSEAEVQSLYGEYKGLSAMQGKTVKLDGSDKEYTVDNGSNVRVESHAQEFPKILIGGVSAEDVTLSDGVYSASGNGFSYSYTVGNYVNIERVATVTYTDTATSNTRVFTVTQVNDSITVIKLSSLQVKINGVLRNIEGFDSDTTEYKINLTPDDYGVEFVVEVADGGSSNVETVNQNIDYNGENVITTSGNGASGIYKITLQRDRSDLELPTVGGMQLGLTTQNLYVDALPSSVEASSIALVYPNGSAVENLAYNAGSHVLTFQVVDKALGNKTAYTVNYKTKQEGHLAQWSYESSVGVLSNRTFRGQRWDAAQGKYVEDSALDMTVRSGGDNQAVTDSRSAVAATKVSGVLGNGIELPAWAYTTAQIPAVTGGTTGFTFSTWMQTSGNVWEAVFTVLGSEHGTILEKGHMQKHDVSNGQPINGWTHLVNSYGVWADSSLNEDGKKGNFFNTPSNGASYVFYTVTVTYVNGMGTIKFYKDGELAVTYENDVDATAKAQYIIEAMNAGAKVGLHRHHYDGGQKSRFDETNVYAYAMTGTEVKATYDSIAELLTASPEYYDVEGLGYPDLLLGGASSVNVGANGLRTGITSEGVNYSYTALTVASTPDNDEKGVQVTLSKNGNVRVATIKFRRKLNVQAERLAYKIGNGESVVIPVPQHAGEDIIVKVAANADLSDVKAGDIAVKQFAGDSNAQHYTSQFSYSAATQTATVRCTYTVYEGVDTLYTVRFVKKSTETFNAMSVTGGKTALQLTKEDFTENTPTVSVNDTNNFTLTVTLSLGVGAQLEGGGNTKTFTQNDLQDGKLVVTVVNENGDSITYSIKPISYSSDVTLSALSAGSYDLIFVAGTTEYTVTANKGEGAKVFEALIATATDGKATVKKTYDKTENVITVTVTAEDGVTVQKYEIEIEELDTDATLSEIRVGGTPIAGFHPEKTAYTVKYAGTLPEVAVTEASSTAQGASVSAADSNGVVTITVTAENGATKNYTVTLVKMSSDAALKKLTLNGTEITFEGNAAEYHASFGTRLNKIIVIAETAEGASAVHKIAEDKNEITVTVTAEDGTKETYTVTVSIQSGNLFEGGETEDNSPKQSGCASSAGDTAISMGALMLLVGVVWLVVKKARKTR